MAQQKFCQECNQKHAPLETPKNSLTGHECQEVYRHLGKAEGPSVVLKIMVAFLLPMVVFIALLVVFDHILAKVINSKAVQAVVSFLLALAVTSVCVLIIKVIGRRRMTDDR